MVTPHGDVGGLAVVIARAAPVHIRPVVHILGFHHGNRRLTGVAQELEGQIAVKVAEAVAAAHVVGQVGPRQGVSAVEQAHPDHRVGLRRGRTSRSKPTYQ